MPFNFASDGRAFTDYSSPCKLDEKIMKDNGLKTQAEYRAFLQKNAKKLMEINRNINNTNQ